MRRVLILTAVLCQSVFGYASYSGWCENGGVKVTVQGLSSPLTFQQSFPNLLQSATGPNVTVYATGTTNKVTLYSDSAGTALNNPFPCSSDGRYLFFTTNNGTYDLLFSGTGISAFTRGGIQVIDPGSVPYTLNVATACGAIADGTGTAGTDQRTKFQTCVEKLHTAGGGSLFVPWAPLCYSINYPGIQIYSNITIYSNSQSTCLQVTPGAFSDWPGGWTVIHNDDTVDGLTNIHIQNITIDGNRANITGLSSSNLNANAIGLWGASNSSIEDSTIENAGDGVFLNCSGASHLTAGDGVSVTGNLITNNQRNNVSMICGKNVRVENNELSLANGSDPQSGIDLEEDSAGQVVTGFILRGNRIHGNTKDGADLQPAHDSAGTLALIAQNNLVYGNGARGIVAIDFTAGQYLNCDGNTVFGNTGVQIVLEAWAGGSCQGLIASGGAVGLSMINSTLNMVVSGFFSGSSYDLESDALSTPIALNPFLAHGKVHGRAYFHGSFSPNGFDPSLTAAYGYTAQAQAPASTTVADSNGIEVLNGVIGSGGAITAQRGVFCADLTVASFNYCLQGVVSAGTNKFNISINGTARSVIPYLQQIPVNLSVITGLYTCNSTNKGLWMTVDNATSATFGSTITGGGSNVGIAFCDGSNFVFH